MKKALGLLVVLTACGGVEGTDQGSYGQTGRLVVGLTGSGGSASDLDRIMVEIAETRVRGDNGWTTISEGPVSVDILNLGNSTTELGIGELDGSVDQIRLVVTEGSSSYVVTKDGEQHPLKTPSGEQSGLKIKGHFDVAECGDTQVTLDVDSKKSIHVHPSGKGRWILRPVIRVASVTEPDDDCGETPGGGDTPEPLDPLDPNPNDPNDPADPNDPTGPDVPNGGDPTDPGSEPGDGTGTPNDGAPGDGTNDPNDPGDGTAPGDGSGEGGTGEPGGTVDPRF